MSNEQSIRDELSEDIQAYLVMSGVYLDHEVSRSLADCLLDEDGPSVIRRIQAEAWEDARRSVRAIPHWFNTDDKYGEFDLQPLGPDETSEQGAFMAVMEVLNENPYIERGETA